MRQYANIVGWGAAVPRRVVTNSELEKMVDTSDEWIRSRTGISERRIAGPGETTSSLALQAGKQALAVAGLPASDLDIIIVATMTPDYPMPSAAAIVQHGLGASRAGAFDLNAACSGFVYALAVGSQLIVSGMSVNVLVIGADTISNVIDWTDRNTCVLFGDGAGAVLLQATDQPGGLLSCVLGTDGAGVDALIIPAGGSRNPASVETVTNRQHYVKMNGNEVYRFAVNAISRSMAQAIERAGLSSDEIDLFIPHQANIRIIQSAAKALNFPHEKVFTNVERYGNTSSASIPIALCEAIEQGRVRAGDNLAFVGFGAGLTWAASVVRWTVDPAAAARVNGRIAAEGVIA